MHNRPFAASHSRGTKPPCWRGADVDRTGTRQVKENTIKIKYASRLSFPSETFSLEGFIPLKWLSAKSLLNPKQETEDPF